MIKNKFKIYIKIITLAFVSIAIQVAAMAEIPPRVRAQKIRSIEKLVPNFLSRPQAKMKFFQNDMTSMDSKPDGKLDPKFKKVMIINPKRKEKSSTPDNKQSSLKEVEKESVEFVSAVEFEKKKLKILNDAA